MNFDGSFIRDLRRGSYGGMVRDSTGSILCSYSRSVDVLESNEAAVFAMLVGCRELRRLGGQNAIVEGDSFTAIKWGSGNVCYPWRMAH